MATVYPGGIDDWQHPLDSDALSTSPDGRDHQQHHADLIDVVLEMETQLAGPAFTSSGAYEDVAAEVVHSCDATSDGVGTWTAVSGHGGDTPSVDTSNKTEGTGSITCDLNFPSGSGTNGKLYFDLATPLEVGGHGAMTVDVRFHIGSGNGAQGGFRVCASDAAALGGTLVSSDITQDNDSADLWFTITVPLAGLTTVASVGIEKRPAGSGSSSKWVTWWLDNINLREGTALDVALGEVDGAVVVPSDYVASVEQFADTYSDVRAVLDLRPAHATHPGINGTYNLRDWRLDETGTEDVTEDLQRIVDSLPDGSTLLAPASGVFRIDDSVAIGVGKRYFTFDGQGSRWVQPTEVNSQFFNVSGTENTIRGVRGYSLNQSTSTTSNWASGDSTHPIVGTPAVNGTSVDLATLNDQVEVPWRGDDEVAYWARDHNGVNSWDFVLQDTNQVTNDCKFTIMEPDGTVLQTTTQTLTAIPTTYTVTYTPTNLYLPLRVAISKATATTNTITLSSATLYGRQRYDASLAFNHLVLASGDSVTVRDCWGEGFGGDIVTTGGAQGLLVENVNGRVIGRQGMSFNTGQYITMRNCEIVGAARHAVDLEPETNNVFVQDLVFENCRFIDPGLGFFACTAYPHVRRVHMRDCDFLRTSRRGGDWFSGGWWEGSIDGCTFISKFGGPHGPVDVIMRGVSITNCTASGGLKLSLGGRSDENGTSAPSDYVYVSGWRSYDPDVLFESEITNYTFDVTTNVALDGSYGTAYP